ncbi:undecaprenyl diphosphate synthase family protein, partial [Candidatus Saccharibacteria bacterium]|nr:undecaprenyl diphosphate synthase family protein [Candidatus Saccharibacteria bacterium]
GEQRISNYMLWRAAYSELYFSSKLWPDFTPNDLDIAMDDYSKRQRRYGA